MDDMPRRGPGRPRKDETQDAEVQMVPLGEAFVAMESRLTALETMVEDMAATLVASPAVMRQNTAPLAAIALDRRSREGLLLWARRTQGTTDGPLTEILLSAMGLE